MCLILKTPLPGYNDMIPTILLTAVNRYISFHLQMSMRTGELHSLFSFKMKFLNIFLWILFFSQESFAENICEVTHCSCDSSNITCRGKDPQQYSIQVNQKYQYLDFQYCKIDFLMPGYLDRYTKLKRVDVRHQTVDFNCKSAPIKPNFIFLSKCENEKTTLETSTFISQKTTEKFLSTSLKTIKSSTVTFYDKTTSQSSSVKTTHKFSNPVFSTAQMTTNSKPVLSSAYISTYFPFSSEQTNTIFTSTESSPLKTLTTLNAVTSKKSTSVKFETTSFYQTFTAPTPAAEKKLTSDKLAWIILSIILTLIVFLITGFIACLFYLRKRSQDRQMRNLDISRPIYFGANFDPFEQVVAEEPPAFARFEVDDTPDSEL